MHNGAKKSVSARTRRRLKDKVAIVVGAGRGIGEAIALRFAKEGARLVLAARTASELDTVAAQIRAGKSKALVHATDVTDRLQVNHLVEALHKYSKRTAVLVNAAVSYRPIRHSRGEYPEKCVKTFSMK